MQQFEAEITAIKDAEQSRRLDLVEERDDLRAAVAALDSKVARAVAQKAGVEETVNQLRAEGLRHSAQLLHAAATRCATLKLHTHLQRLLHFDSSRRNATL